MEKIKAGLRGLNAGDKIVLGKVVREHLSGNPYFPGMDPMLAELEQLTERLRQTNVAALDRGRTACALKRVAIAEFDSFISRIAAHVNSVAAGDVQKLLSSGFPLARRQAPVNDLGKPMTWDMRPTQYENRVELRWERIPGALVYQVETCQDPFSADARWEQVAITSRPNTVVARMTASRENMYRVRAIGSQVQGPYSGVIKLKAA